MATQRLSILGVGLLGGSIGLAARSRSKRFHVTGYGHREVTVRRAVEVGAIDESAETAAAAVRKAQLVILCTPVGRFEEMLREIAPALPQGAIVTDVGSTKRSFVRAAEKLLPKHVHFIGSHPIAGSEKRGIEFARADLLHNALCITTPTPRSDAGALKAVEAFWSELGMRIARLSPQEHDRLLADISHLPHVLAAAIVAMQRDEALSLSGKGFLDATRIAGGDGALWRDILLDNRDNLKRSLEGFQNQLKQFARLLDSKTNDDALVDWLNHAAQRREKLVKQKLREMRPD